MVETGICVSKDNDAWKIRIVISISTYQALQYDNKHKWALKSKYGNEVQHRSRPAPQGIPTYNNGGDKLRKA